MGTHLQGLALTWCRSRGAKAFLAMGPHNIQTKGGWKGTQVSWAGRGTRQTCQFNQELRDLGSLPSTAESAVAGGNL